MTRHRRTPSAALLTPATGLAVGALLVALLVAGCAPDPTATGGPAAPPGSAPLGSAPSRSAPPGPVASPAPTGSAAGSFNAVDVMFLQMMVTHHDQALELVRLAQSRAGRTELRTLASAIDVTQAAERETMRQWLRDWGKATSADPNAHAHAEHGGLPATGPEQIAALARSTGAQFETAFLNLLIAHQHNAVEMARREIDYGVHAEARELARRIDLSRTAQIDQMLKLLPPAG